MPKTCPTAAAPANERPDAEGLTEELIATLRRHGQTRAQRRRRTARRHPWRCTLDIKVEGTAAGAQSIRTVRIGTTDISAGGFGCVCPVFLHPGMRVFAELPLDERCLVEGVVRSCVLLDGHRHRVGIEFVRLTQIT